MLNRRKFLSALVAAPAVCYAAHLMPLRGEKFIFQRITFPVNSPHMTMGALPEFGVLGQLHYENVTPSAVLKRWDGKEWTTLTSFSPMEVDPEIFAKTEAPVFKRAAYKPEGDNLDFNGGGGPLSSNQEANLNMEGWWKDNPKWTEKIAEEYARRERMIKHSQRVTERAYELWDGTMQGESKARQQAMKEILNGTQVTV